MSFLILILLILTIVWLIAWFTLFIEILKNEFTENNKIIWLLVIIFLPLIGDVLYITIGRKQIIGFKENIDRKPILNNNINHELGNWLSSRRTDQVEKVATAICPKCGALMKIRKYKSGHREGAEPLVCVNWPDCKTVKWG